MQTAELPPSRAVPADLKSAAAEASSAHSRLNIPLNLDNWKHLSPAIQSELTWFHQTALNDGLTLDECAAALNYERSVMYRVLRGIYEGSWENICKSIQSYRRLYDTRCTIQKNEFVKNGPATLIWSGLDYALSNNSITVIEGESRMGKTTTCKAWQLANNHGRSAFIIAPAYGGTRALLHEVAKAVGVNQNKSTADIHGAILRAFNGNRILIVDEAHRLLPYDKRCNPVNLEILRDIHDRTGCALALIATARFGAALQKGEYMFEQLIGRIGMPIRLPRKIKASDIEPILRQYVPRVNVALTEACLEVANKPGRLGILVETLKVASRMAKKKSQPLNEGHIFGAMKLREQMQGEVVYAEK